MVFVKPGVAGIIRAQAGGSRLVIVPDGAPDSVLNLARAVLDAAEVRELEQHLRQYAERPRREEVAAETTP